MNALSRASGDEVMIAVDDQGCDLEALELGEQVIVGLGPCILHEPVFGLALFYRERLDEVHMGDEAADQYDAAARTAAILGG